MKKHNLSTVQESEDVMPFAKKMDYAVQFIADTLQGDLGQFENFGKVMDASEAEICNHMEEERQEMKNKPHITGKNDQSKISY